MSLRIAVDLDGTLADMESALEREAEQLFGPDIDLRVSLRGRPEGASGAEAPDPTSGSPGMRRVAQAPGGRRLTDRQQRQLWARVRDIDNFWRSLKEIEPGAVSRLAEAAAANRWEVIFLTQRPSSGGETAQVQTQRWLVEHGFELPSVYVLTASRGQVAAALELDAVVDDRPENCLDVASDSHARPFLVWRDAPETVPPGAARLGVDVVFSVGEALERLQALGRRVTQPTGLLGRLRTTLGI